MQVAITAAGFTAGEADTLRRAMGHKRSRERMAAICRKMIDGMIANGFDEIIVKTKNRYYGMRGTLDSLQFNIIKLEPADDPLDSKVYMSKRLGPFVLDAHRSRRVVSRG